MILEIFWWPVDNYCWVLDVAPLTDVGKKGIWEEERDLLKASKC